MAPSGDTTVRCQRCRSVQRVSLGRCVAHGWPRCHGATMRLERTAVDVETVISRVLGAHPGTVFAAGGSVGAEPERRERRSEGDDG